MEDRATATEGMQISATGVPGEFIMHGILTIEHAAGIRREFLDIFGRHDAIVMHIDGETTIDLSFLQLLCSACRTAMKQGKSFSVRNGLPDRCRALVDETGYSREKGCGPHTKKYCLWLPEEGR